MTMLLQIPLIRYSFQTQFSMKSLFIQMKKFELFEISLIGTTYKATMSQVRFKFLRNSIHFNDKTTRATRK